MRLAVSCKLQFHVSEETALIVMLRPFRGLQQWINRETFTLLPASVQLLESSDGFGNACQRLLARPGDFLIHTSAEVIATDRVESSPGAPFIEIQHLPDDTLPFLLPSRYCESDRFGDMAREIVYGAIPGYDQVAAIVGWVRRSVDYIPGSSGYPLSSVEIHQRGYGVCRDLAQLCIALCRSISIPARLVVGYVHNLHPMDLHAWFEAYIGHRWYTFDPTQPSATGGRVIIAFGRDAADVSIFHQFGSACVLNGMDVQVELLDNFPFT